MVATRWGYIDSCTINQLLITGRYFNAQMGFSVHLNLTGDNRCDHYQRWTIMPLLLAGLVRTCINHNRRLFSLAEERPSSFTRLSLRYCRILNRADILDYLSASARKRKYPYRRSPVIQFRHPLRSTRDSSAGLNSAGWCTDTLCPAFDHQRLLCLRYTQALPCLAIRSLLPPLF